MPICCQSTLQNSWNIYIMRLTICAFGAHPLGWSGLDNVCWCVVVSWWVSNFATLGSMVFVWQCDNSKIWVLWCFTPSVGLGLTFKFYCLIMVCHRAKFSSYKYSSWSIKIAGMKNLGVQGHRPLGVGLGASLTYPVSWCVIVQNLVALQRRRWCQIMDKFFVPLGTSSHVCWQPKILSFCLKPNTNENFIQICPQLFELSQCTQTSELTETDFIHGQWSTVISYVLHSQCVTVKIDTAVFKTLLNYIAQWFCTYLSPKLLSCCVLTNFV